MYITIDPSPLTQSLLECEWDVQVPYFLKREVVHCKMRLLYSTTSTRHHTIHKLPLHPLTDNIVGSRAAAFRLVCKEARSRSSSARKLSIRIKTSAPSTVVDVSAGRGASRSWGRAEH